MNDSRTRQVTVAPVIVRAPAGRALTGGTPAPGAGGVPPGGRRRGTGRLRESSVAAATAGAANVADAATVAKAVRESERTRSLRAIAAGDRGAERRAGAPPAMTPVADRERRDASVNSVERLPPSSAVTRGSEPSSSRGEPSVIERRFGAQAQRAGGPRARSRHAALSGSVTLRPLRAACPVVRTRHAARVERRSAFAVSGDREGAGGGRGRPNGPPASASATAAPSQRFIAPGARS